MIRHLLLFSCTLLSLPAMSLTDTVTYALEHNSALAKVNLSVERSKAQRELRSSQKFGRVDMIASYDHYNNARTLAPLTPMSIVGSPDGAYTIPTTQDLFSVGVAYNVILFDGFSQQNSYKISDLQYKNSAIKNKLGREELIYNVRSLYISILSLEEQLSAQKLFTKSQERFLERIKKEKALGSKSKLDLLRAKSSLEAARSQVSSLEANIAILKGTLSSLMGDRTFDKTSPIEVSIEKDTKRVVSEKDILSLGRYEATNLNIEMSKKREAQADAAYYPKVDFSAYYGQNFGPNDTTNTVPLSSTAPTAGETLISSGDWNNEDNWQLGVHLKWNLLDFGQSSALSQEAHLSYLQAKLEKQSVKSELEKDVVIAQNNIKLAMAQYDNFSAQYDLLLETEKIEQVRYDNSALSLTDLLDTTAKKELIHAQLINAKYSYKKANYYLDYLLEKGEEK